MVSVIVFDFDGVLVDSNRLKYDAFLTVVGPKNAGVAARVLRRWRELPRRDILARIAAGVGIPASERRAWVEKHAQLYGRIVRRQIEAVGLVPGARPVLQALSRRAALYVSSSTPQAELRALLGDLGARRFFKGTFGWPRTKVETLRRIVASGVEPQRIVVVGDGRGDRRSAARCRCRFVGIVNEFNGWVPSRRRRQIRGLDELAHVLP